MSQQAILDRCKEVVAKAKELYGLDLSQVHVSFDLRGRCAGMAHGGRTYKVRFNRDMLTREAFDHVLNATVPHEYAHIICFMNPRLGRNHDSGWERVCIALGGSGATRHQEEVVYGNGTTYEYTSTTGQAIRVSERRHRSIQAGRTLHYRKGGGTLHKDCAHSIVGVLGQTLAAPVVKKAVTTPAAVQTVTVPPVYATMLTGAVPRQTAVLPVATAYAGESKASISRRIMSVGYRAGKTYEQIIAEMIAANGYNRQLARATYKANYARAGVPESF